MVQIEAGLFYKYLVYLGNSLYIISYNLYPFIKYMYNKLKIDTKSSGYGLKYFLHLRWKDRRLSWETDPAKLEVTQLSWKQIWTPDLINWGSLQPESDFITPTKTLRVFR